MDHLAKAIRCETNSMTSQILHNSKKNSKQSKMFFLEKLMLIPKPTDLDCEYSEGESEEEQNSESNKINEKKEKEETKIDIEKYLESWDTDIFNIYQSAKRSKDKIKINIKTRRILN
jgi:hypothetical protein